MEKVYIFGHRNPDTDSVTAAITLSYLKNKLGMNTIPAVLSSINLESKFALNYFNVPEPIFLNDVNIKLRDLKYTKNYTVKEKDSIYEAYFRMNKVGISKIPVVDKDKNMIGILSMKDIAKDQFAFNYSYVDATYDNICEVIKGTEILRFDDDIEGELLVASYKSTTFMEEITLNKNNILINGKVFNTNDFNIININEETDFSNEFKFTKNNTLRQLIYNDISKKINENKIIEYTNEIFDIIDEKINNLLDKKINKKSDNNIYFEIEIPNINSIIDKFTNIYIDDMLLTDNKISKSMKRKLLYQLYFLDIKKLSNKPTIVIINNFDVYLNSEEIIKLLNDINSLTNDNCHFILSSCNNIFEYINLKYYNIYKITNKVISINEINNAIKTFLIKNEYKSNNTDIEFNEFYNNNEYLISEEEISNIRNLLFNIKPYLINKILNSNNIKLVLSKPNNINQDYIICENNKEKELFNEICLLFIDHKENI